MKKYIQYFKNERGGMAALLSVIVLSGIAVTTLTSAYVFLENKAKYNNRIIGSYQTSYGLEDLALNLRQVYDSSIAVGATVIHQDGSITKNEAACNAGSTPVNFINDSMILCVPNTMYRETTVDAFGCTLGPCFCVQTSSGVGQNGVYCTSLANPPEQAQILHEQSSELVSKKSLAQKWFAKMDYYFDDTVVKNKKPLQDKARAVVDYQIKVPTVLGWLLPSAQAYSQSFLEDRGKSDFPGPIQQENGIDETAKEDAPVVVVQDEKTDEPVGDSKEKPISEVGDSKGGGDQGTNPITIGGGTGRPGGGNGGYPGDAEKGAYRLSVQSCEGGIASESCERCQGIECAELTSRSVMCANLQNQSECPYGVGRIHIKFE